MADDIREALAEAEQLLAEIRNGTPAILPDSPTKKSKKLGKGLKTSSWAKSSSARTHLPTAPAYSKQEAEDSPKVAIMSKSTGGYTMPKASRSAASSAATDVPFYDVNIDIVSTKKRPISAVVMTKSETRTGKKLEAPISNQMEEDVQHAMFAPKTDSGGAAFSFGKSKRDIEMPRRTSQEGPSTVLDVSRGEKLLWQKPQTSFVFDKAKRDFDTDSRSDKPDTSEGDSGTGSDSGQRGPLHQKGRNDSVLSHHPAAPMISIPPEHKTKPRRILNPTPGDISTPGPGAYSDAVTQIYSMSSGTRGVKFNPGPSRAARKARRIINAAGADPNAGRAPGPGQYDVSGAETTVRQKVAGFSNVFKPSDADRKLTPQLLRKRYWEDKARDLREEHDDMKEASDSFVSSKPRASAVMMRPDQSSGITYKNRAIMRKIRADKAKEASIGFYDKKYDAVEKAPPAPVRMDREVEAVSKTHAMLAKANIIPGSSRRAIEAAARDKFLGPQLPVPWGEDRLPARSVGKEVDGEDPSGGRESPTEEVLALLRRRGGGEDVPAVGSLPDGFNKGKRDEDDTTEAFLRSSYAGAPTKNAPAVAIRPPSKHDARKFVERELTDEERNRDFLPTQLHHEWGDTERRDTAHKALLMEIAPGREIVKVHAKGVVDRVLFNEGIRRGTDTMGPGLYDTDPGFGKAVTGGIVDFEHYVAREDAVGPHGERPQAAQSTRDMEEEGLYYSEEVIMDAVAAKQKQLKREPVTKFNDRDRFPPPKPQEEGLTHLGGSWFEGMATETARKATNAVNYETMLGRGQEEEEALDELASLIDEGHDGDVVAVEVADWKPHKERVISGPAWTDVKKDPRFVDKKLDRDPDAPPSPEPNYEYLKPRKGVGVVDFGLQKERWTKGDEEEQVVREELDEDGYAEARAAREDATDLDLALMQGEEKQSKKKKDPVFVDMNRQQQRKGTVVKSAAPDVVYDVKEGVLGTEDRRDKGVLDWRGQQGREARLITKAKVSDEVYSDDEEVIMDLHPDKRSNVRRTVTAPAWSTDKAPKTLPAREPIGIQLDYEVDKEFGRGAKGVPMAGQRGRNDDPSLQEVGLAGDDSDEELDLEPDFALLKSGKGDGAAAGGVAWGKTSGRSDRVTETQGPDSDPPEGGVLDIDPMVPRYGVSGKTNTGFGGKASDDNTRRGAAEALESLEKEQEELDLRPQRMKDKPKNTQASWNKESAFSSNGVDDGVKRALRGLVDEEELQLSPKNTVGIFPNTMLSWNKQTAKRDDRPDHVGIDADYEELILSPHEPEDNRRRAAASWSKQADTTTDAKLSVLDDTEELLLDPKKANAKKQKSGVPWNKQRDSSFDKNGSLVKEMEEELILSPKEAGGGNRPMAVMSWKNESERVYVTGREALQEQKSEELILDPKEVRTSRGKNALSWQKQRDSTYDSNEALDRDAEELILSPKLDLTERASGGNIATAWRNQASRVLSDDKAGYQPSEELKLSPKDYRKREPPSTLQWSRQSDMAATIDNTRSEELYLSPKDKRSTGGGQVSSMKSKSGRIESGVKERGDTSASQNKTNLKPRSQLSVSFQEVDGGKRTVQNAAGSTASSKFSSKGTTGSGAVKTKEMTRKTTAAARTQGNGGDSISNHGKRRTTSTSRSKAPVASATTGTDSSIRQKSAGKSSTKQGGGGTSGSSSRSRRVPTAEGGVTSRIAPEASTTSPPRVQAPTPIAAAPEGFARAPEGDAKRSSTDVMASLDRRIEQLYLYD